MKRQAQHRNRTSVVTLSIASVTGELLTEEEDELSVEEPLEIRVCIPRQVEPLKRSIAVTMRTPGADAELAAGFLLTEGLVRARDDIRNIEFPATNVAEVTLAPHVVFDPARFERGSFVSSSCGVCGKRSMAAVFAVQHFALRPGSPRISVETIHGLAAAQRAAQRAFERTGGLHAAALFETDGRLRWLFEDVGRHNALDKLIGAELLAGRLPLSQEILLVSGRASFELVQKAVMAGIPMMAAVGAPSSLAVALARHSHMTLLGFVRDQRFNIYADAGRLSERSPGLCPTAGQESLR
jgi:FdhD protein